MKNRQNFQNEFNENIFLNVIKFQKRTDFKSKEKVNNYQELTNVFIIAIILCISLIFIIYLFIKNQQINSPINNSFQSSDIDLYHNDKIIEYYIKAQKDFCNFPQKYYNKKYEKEILLKEVKFNELKYKMYFFKTPNYIIKELKHDGAYEISISNNILDAIKFFALKKNISNNKDILMLDIGGNIGWYPSLLGRYNYTIFSFEAFEKNSYVSKKNFCYLNKNSNVVIITKGLGKKERICNYFGQKNNEGNGMVICDNKKHFNYIDIGRRRFIKKSEVRITTLKPFYPYLSNKNIALMKLDVEGNEWEILEGGKELITKYHVPFVILEFSPYYLKEVGSLPKKLIDFFLENGYKISLDGFLNQKYINSDELLFKAGFQINTYFIHNSMI